MDVLFEKNTASTLEVGVTSHIVQNKNNLPILGNPHPPKKRRLEENQVRIPSGKKIVQGLQGTGPPQSAGWMQQALDESVRNVLTSATSTISYQPISSVTSPVSYQLPVPISSTNVKVNPGTTSHFSLNAGAFGHPYNPPSIKPHVAPQTSQDFFATVSKKVLAPCPCLPSINSHLHQNPPSIQPRVAHQTSQDFLATVSQKVLTPISELRGRGSWRCGGTVILGELGLGNLDSQWKPVVCPAFRDRTLKAIACGGAHTLFLTDNGCVYATGLNDFGQLGVSESKHYSVHSLWTSERTGKFYLTAFFLLGIFQEPLCVFGEEKKVVQVSAGYNHSCAITVDGELYMWGKNTSVQLGLGKNGGEAFSWGVGVSGRLGHGHESSILGFFKSYSEYTPRLIKDLEGIKV
ncbi:hypothetical protein JHK85_015793 [Glycine max]|nr:hypothetical protein JHK85_015793 [Glycine max]